MAKFFQTLFLSAAFLCCHALSCSALDSLQQGIQLYNKRDFKNAVTSLDKAAKSQSTQATAYYYEALCYSQLGDREKALYYYSLVSRSFPNSNEGRLAASYIQTIGTGRAPRTASTIAPAPAASSRMSIAGGEGFANASDDELRLLPTETTVPFSRGQGGHLYVDAQINGRTIRSIFDTGASVCLFGKQELQNAGVALTLGAEKIPLGGVGSQTLFASPMMVNVKLGRVERRMPILVQEGYNGPPLLGQTFYNGYRYEIDNVSGIIRFVKKSSAAAAVPYDAIAVPFRVEGNDLVVTAQINGMPCEMFFDTGAAHNVFSGAQFASLGIPMRNTQMVMTGGIGGSAPGYVTEVDSIKLGSMVKNNVTVTVMPYGGPPKPLLGQPFFGDRKFVIDNDKQVIRIYR